MKTVCYHCGAAQEVPDEVLGTETTCSQCQERFTVEVWNEPRVPPGVAKMYSGREIIQWDALAPISKWCCGLSWIYVFFSCLSLICVSAIVVLWIMGEARFLHVLFAALELFSLVAVAYGFAAIAEVAHVLYLSHRDTEAEHPESQ